MLYECHTRKEKKEEDIHCVCVRVSARECACVYE